mmetsp:Transcript_88149/g.139333  ORF Transcript_88149/g.139333 Transcript_88149/m.139333 type:complete len:483 (-) Transcript_88149:35-1483(-)
MWYRTSRVDYMRFQLQKLILLSSFVTLNADAVKSCGETDELAAVSRSSLLQRASRHTLVASKDYSARSLPCKGVNKFGRCWYLSDLGESCAETCAKHGQIFSFAMADTSNPMIPLLIGSQPKVKQEPWAALECFVPNEDRYHLASAKAAEGSTSDLSTWSYNTCQLSCPCDDAGECKWTQPPACASQFDWKGKTYKGCTSVDSDIPWCQHHHHHSAGTADMGEELRDWSYCTYDCAPEVVPYADESHCVWKSPQVCASEFDYEHAHYIGCTASEHTTPWCSLTEIYSGLWVNCIYICDDGQQPNKSSSKPVQDDILCAWELAAECPEWFIYKGINYTGCTEEDHEMPWCSHDNVHGRGWSPCARVCTNASTSTTSPLISSAPAPSSAVAYEACVRWNRTGWHEGDYKQMLPPQKSPDGREWTWHQCAKECSGSSTCEFWTLRLPSLGGDCLLLANKGEFHPDELHIEGPRIPFCEDLDVHAF